MQTFSDVATAAYCPRKLYYRHRNDDFEAPERIRPTRELAFRNTERLDPETDLSREPIEPTPTQYRTNLGRAKARIDRFDEIATPAARRVLLEGKDARGYAAKLLDDPPVPTIISTGSPPDEGVWQPQSVRATAAAKALAWERKHPVDRAFVEYPAYGIVRKITMSTRRKAIYRRTLRTARSIDGPPPRLHDESRCGACEYRTECGTRTRSLRSLL